MIQVIVLNLICEGKGTAFFSYTQARTNFYLFFLFSHIQICICQKKVVPLQRKSTKTIISDGKS